MDHNLTPVRSVVPGVLFRSSAINPVVSMAVTFPMNFAVPGVDGRSRSGAAVAELPD